MLCFLYSQGPAIVIVIRGVWWFLESVNNLIKDLYRNNQFTVGGPDRSSELSQSSRVLVKNGQLEVCFSLGYLFLGGTQQNCVESKWLSLWLLAG